MGIKQIDVFGNEISVEDLPKKTGGRKYKTMQQLHGELSGKKCGDCVHCLKVRYHRKTYYKCELWHMSNSEATDIRLKNVACGKFAEY